MRISAKGRYALASVIRMGQNYGNNEYNTVISISEKLGISKIYLEQVFSLLKRGGVVTSVKGAQGGYLLTRSPEAITVYDVLSAVEFSLFEATEESVAKKAGAIESAMQSGAFQKLDAAIAASLREVTVADLITEAEKYKDSEEMMFYI